MSEKKLIILRGYPGSGKTTVGKQLETSGVGKFIDHNAILTFVAQIAGNDDGIYSQIADLEFAICSKLLKEGQTVIVARGFSKLNNIATYEKIANELGVIVKIIRLEVSSDELSKRVVSPERKLDFNPTVGVDDLNEWIENNPLEIHSEEIIINNQKPLIQVINEIVEVVKF